MKRLLLCLPILFTGCHLFAAYSPAPKGTFDYTVEEGQPAKPVAPAVEVTPPAAPVTVSAPAADCANGQCSAPSEAGPVRRVVAVQPVRRVVGRAVAAFRFGRAR